MENKKAESLLGFGTIKSMASGEVVIEGLANKKIVDRGNDIINTDAWDLENFKKNPVILYNHGFDPQLGGTPIGKAIDVKPTEDGLYIKAKLSNLDDPMLNRIRGLVKEKILRAFSVGFNPIEADMDPKTGLRTIKKAELFEVSVVGVPMNQDSLFELSSKMLNMPVDKLKKDILTRKGAWVAATIHDKIYERQKDGNLDREAAIKEIAEMAGVEIDDIMNVLAGNTTPVPESILAAVSNVLEIDIDELNRLNAGDVEVEKDETPEGTEEEEEEEDVEGDIESEESMGAGSEASNKDDASTKDFQDCVAEKIPKLIEEGREQEQAIAIAISMCSEGKCKTKPTKDQYSKWFKIADAVKKQADQNEAGVSDVTTTINATKTEAENNDFGSPMLDAQKQTNVLLGALINEIQKLSAKMDQTQKQNPEEVADEVGAATDSQSSSSLEDRKNRSEKFGIEVLESANEAFPDGGPKTIDGYGDPVNLKYPIDSAEQANSSRKKFKENASEYSNDKSKSVVHSRIVSAQLGFGEKVDYSDEDEMDKMLNDELKSKLKESQAKMLDSFIKRIENVKKKLNDVEQAISK
jgi:HK97 family phage prohead protease